MYSTVPPCNKEETHDNERIFQGNVVIIGTGPAGLTAVIYAARAGFKPLYMLEHNMADNSRQPLRLKIFLVLKMGYGP